MFFPKSANQVSPEPLIKLLWLNQVFSFLRKNGERELLVILNLSANEDLHFEIKDEKVSGIYREVFLKKEIDLTVTKSLSLKAWDYLVYEK